MNDYESLLAKLKNGNFPFIQDGEKAHAKVEVLFDRVNDFAMLVQAHLNAPYNYVDLQFPSERKTVVIFRDRVFFIENKKQSEKAKEWAIEQGLPVEQADWEESF